MAVTKWQTPASVETILTSTLDSLATGNNKITTTAVSNDASSELTLYGDFILSLALQASARDSGARVDLYLLPRSDGTNYPYGSDSLVPSNNQFVGSFLFDAAITARHAILRNIILPPMDFQVLVINQTGQAFASSGNILRFRRYNLETV